MLHSVGPTFAAVVTREIKISAYLRIATVLVHETVMRLCDAQHIYMQLMVYRYMHRYTMALRWGQACNSLPQNVPNALRSDHGQRRTRRGQSRCVLLSTAMPMVQCTSGWLQSGVAFGTFGQTLDLSPTDRFTPLSLGLVTNFSPYIVYFIYLVPSIANWYAST